MYIKHKPKYDLRVPGVFDIHNMRLICICFTHFINDYSYLPTMFPQCSPAIKIITGWNVPWKVNHCLSIVLLIGLHPLETDVRADYVIICTYNAIFTKLGCEGFGVVGYQTRVFNGIVKWEHPQRPGPCQLRSSRSTSLLIFPKFSG